MAESTIPAQKKTPVVRSKSVLFAFASVFAVIFAFTFTFTFTFAFASMDEVEFRL